ncbi:MAG: redoxin domain-containing protein [Pseudomonadota bacterium]
MFTRRHIFALAIGTAAAAMLAARASAAAGSSAHAFSFPSLEGGEIRLSDYAGRAVLVVNTASFCGFTPQFEALQALADAQADRLVVLGVPSDSFNQEAESAEAVAEFCAVNYAITFPMTDILPVKGSQAHPFYRWARAKGAVPRWNFHKILLGPDGRFVADFSTQTRPDAPRLTRQIDRALNSARTRPAG